MLPQARADAEVERGERGRGSLDEARSRLAATEEALAVLHAEHEDALAALSDERQAASAA